MEGKTGGCEGALVGEGEGRELLDCRKDERSPKHRAEVLVKEFVGGWAFEEAVDGGEVSEAFVVRNGGKTGQTVKEHALKVGGTSEEIFLRV